MFRGSRHWLATNRGRRACAVAVIVASSAAALDVGVAPAQASPARVGDRSSASAFVSRIQWTSSAPAPGVELLDGTFHDPSVHPDWTVTIQAPTQNPFTGSVESAEAGSSGWARHTENALIADGFAPTATVLRWPRYVDDPRGVLGVRVQVGEYATQAAATGAAVALAAAGFVPLVEWEGFDPRQPPDVELLHAAIVDPQHFGGHVTAIHGPAIASRATVSAQAQQVGSIAAVNGGFFTISSPLTAVAGVPTGLGVYAGKLEAMANNARADLVLDGRQPARIENLRSSAQLRDGRSVATILGINREPGSAEDCGVPGLAPTSAPRQGIICTGANDLVLFTPEFGATLPAGSGLQATIDTLGRVTALGTPGGSLPPGDSAVQAIGSDADWLASHIHVGDRAIVTEQLRAPSGAPFGIDQRTSIVSAAPILLRGGHVAIDAVQEGVFDPRDLNNYSFSAERHARTIAGVDRDGRLILVTADGIPGVSEGLTLTEEAELMRTLGAVDAMNLDGGGSTTFVADGEAINDPSDSTGERPVGDSVQIVP
jgi:hypothetical protein